MVSYNIGRSVRMARAWMPKPCSSMFRAIPFHDRCRHRLRDGTCLARLLYLSRFHAMLNVHLPTFLVGADRADALPAQLTDA